MEIQGLNRRIGEAADSFRDHEQRTTTVISGLVQSQEDMRRLLETKLEDIRADVAENSTNMFLSGQLNSLLPPTAVAVHLSYQQRSLCVPSCPCPCHTWRYLKSPRVLDRLIGSLVIGYSGVPLRTRKCLATTCRSEATYALNVWYKFPLWVVAQAVTFALYSRYGQPTAGLSMARIRPHNSRIFSWSESGNIQGLKYLFQNGLASPFDISAQTGDQPLHVKFSVISRLFHPY